MGSFQGMRNGNKGSGGGRTSNFGMPNYSHRDQIRRVTSSLASDQELEHQRWANVMAQDHSLLRQVLERFDGVDGTRQRTMLVRVALDFHEMHTAFEAVWMSIAELAPARIILDDLAEVIGNIAPTSARYWSLALSWRTHLIALMRQEHFVHARKLSPLTPFAPWSMDVLEWRVSLCAEMRATLKMEIIDEDT